VPFQFFIPQTALYWARGNYHFERPCVWMRIQRRHDENANATSSRDRPARRGYDPVGARPRKARNRRSTSLARGNLRTNPAVALFIGARRGALRLPRPADATKWNDDAHQCLTLSLLQGGIGHVLRGLPKRGRATRPELFVHGALAEGLPCFVFFLPGGEPSGFTLRQSRRGAGSAQAGRPGAFPSTLQNHDQNFGTQFEPAGRERLTAYGCPMEAALRRRGTRCCCLARRTHRCCLRGGGSGGGHRAVPVVVSATFESATGGTACFLRPSQSGGSGRQPRIRRRPATLCMSARPGLAVPRGAEGQTRAGEAAPPPPPQYNRRLPLDPLRREKSCR